MSPCSDYFLYVDETSVGRLHLSSLFGGLLLSCDDQMGCVRKAAKF